MGIYTGPLIGQFVVTCFCHNKLDAVFTKHNGPQVILRFVRFSANPHP